VCDGTSAVGESLRGASVGQPTEPCLEARRGGWLPSRAGALAHADGGGGGGGDLAELCTVAAGTLVTRAPVVATRPAVFDLIHVRVAATSGPGPGSRADGVPALRRPSNLDRRAPRRSQAGLCRTRFCSAPDRLAGSCRGVQGEAGLVAVDACLAGITNLDPSLAYQSSTCQWRDGIRLQKTPSNRCPSVSSSCSPTAVAPSFFCLWHIPTPLQPGR
jgi:hypothetical protein